MFFNYKGQNVAYFVTGTGPALLMLHGWGCTHSIYDVFVPEFSRSHKVVTLDFPGFGESAEPSAVWGVEEYTSCLEALCDSLSIEKPDIVGHSFGGRVAIVFASRRSVNRLVLVDSAGIKPARSLGYHLRVGFYKTVKFFLLKVLANESLFLRYRASKGSADYQNASPRMKAVLSKVVNEDLRSLMPGIKIGVLLFWGDKDTATPIRDAHLMEKLFPDAGLVVVPGGTHYSFLEAPSLFVRVLNSFLV